MTDPAAPPNSIRLRSWGHLQRLAARGGLIVILDYPTESRYHDPGCDHVAEQYFEEKKSNGWRNGAYYWIEDASDATGFAVPCSTCL